MTAKVKLLNPNEHFLVLVKLLQDESGIPIDYAINGLHVVTGVLMPNLDWEIVSSKGFEVSVEIFPSTDESVLTVDLRHLAENVSLVVVHDNQVEAMYGIGDSHATYITAYDRERYAALEGARAYVTAATACARVLDDRHDNEGVCGHTKASHEHGLGECREIVDSWWNDHDDGVIYCDCEGYLKPAPLALIQENLPVFR